MCGGKRRMRRSAGPVGISSGTASRPDRPDRGTVAAPWRIPASRSSARSSDDTASIGVRSPPSSAWRSSGPCCGSRGPHCRTMPATSRPDPLLPGVPWRRRVRRGRMPPERRRRHRRAPAGARRPRGLPPHRRSSLRARACSPARLRHRACPPARVCPPARACPPARLRHRAPAPRQRRLPRLATTGEARPVASAVDETRRGRRGSSFP